MNKFLKDFHTVKKMNKTLQDLNVEIESITKTHTEENIEVKTLANQTGTTKSSLNNII